MFTVLNKDVKSSAYLSACVCFLIIPLFLNARVLNSNYHVSGTHYGSNDIHESYEDYLSDGVNRIDAITSRQRTNKRHNKRESSAHELIASPGKKTSFITYLVKKKDTLTRISRRFNIPVSTIKKYNRLDNIDSIRVGMTIKIPRVNPGIHVKKTSNNPIYSASSRPRFRWPVPRVIQYKNDGLEGVKPIGLIITSVLGSQVISSAPGMVKKIGSMRGFGKYIVINHAGRFNTVYSNLNEILVDQGEKVQSGNIIGRIHSSEKKLHFQIDREGKPENPLKYLPKNI